MPVSISFTFGGDLGLFLVLTKAGQIRVLVLGGWRLMRW